MFLLADGNMSQKERRRNYVQHLNKRIEMCRPKASTKERKNESNRKERKWGAWRKKNELSALRRSY